MDNRKFNLWNRISAAAVFVTAAITYLMTIEPSASFWDCGEFIASSYKLEVGHPPGNPVFQLVARFFTMFTDNMHAAVAVNAMSAVCSALTVFFLYLTIVFLAKRLVRPDADGKWSVGQAIAIYGSGIVGSLIYCFSDTFWFSAVEGEVYAMSSLVTALVFWAMTKWYEQADSPYANRWIVLISFLMGLSIGIHLLNLLAIPALVFLYYYRKREDGHYTFWEYVKIFAVGCVILAVILFIIIPFLPKTAAYVDLFFVNVLGLPFNTGAAFFMVALLALCFWGLFMTMKKEKVLANTVLLCFTTIIIGFSIFSIIIIRSSVKTPTNEYQPDNPFTLVRYLGREQYGSNPLIYGQYFDAPYDIEVPEYWAPLGDRYIKTDGQITPVYKSEGKMFFPRMWATSPDGRYEDFYSAYMDGKGKAIPGQTYRKPTFGANLKFFFDYQINWMYWRYFMWNFAGRQNDIHSPVPGELFTGNWESGIGFIDKARLGDQSDAPAYLKDNKAKNHYYMLPLLFGIIGIFFQFARDRRGSWVTFLMFFMTGIAIVIYLNQPPYQVRERDYAYAGSFYAFSIWAGFAVLALYTAVSRAVSNSRAARTAVAAAVSIACLGVPVLMAQQNWDDHDRSNRATAVEMARNYLNSVGPQGILITHGDNDTFPLWYAQEVEDVRTDVRICNTSLLGTDWHIDQMKYACNESKPLPLTVEPDQYLYGTNEFIYIYDTRDTIIPISTVMDVFKHPKAKIELTSGRMVDYIMSRRISVPVNKENVIKYGILEEKYADLIPDEIVLAMPADKDYITKPELFMLDLLSNYQWDRPINLLNMGGDINMGIKDYLMYEGFSYKFVPVKNRMKQTDIGFADADDLYQKMNSVFCWDALKRTDYFADYQNFYTFCGVMSQRGVFLNVAKEQLKADHPERAVELLDRCQECVPESVYPLDMSYLGFINERNVLEMIALYYDAGAPEKGLDLAKRFVDELLVSAKFYMEFYDYARSNFEETCHYIFYVADILKQNGDTEEGEAMEKSLDDLVSSVAE
ncbi:MAG: DUF2723 domain-containing protein [Bacteroidetes bacterium]|uniref:DUF2723 domain-containing protein n=1 Tax=Candidatus Cryptobacteroides intestinavium TaxID=2840766 RepID=A0A9D9EPW0_9BACT|nr:DUF2723 domain-containing protein [Candidatus Cryptobacteroides intestinavium]